MFNETSIDTKVPIIRNSSSSYSIDVGRSNLFLRVFSENSIKWNSILLEPIEIEEQTNKSIVRSYRSFHDHSVLFL